jgi:hypothetical protein
MPTIQLIERYKALLIAVEVVSVALFAAELFYFRQSGVIQPNPITAISILLPPLIATLCFFPLCYLAWFRQESSSPLRRFKLLFFWLFAGVATLAWFNILKASVGHLQ